MPNTLVVPSRHFLKRSVCSATELCIMLAEDSCVAYFVTPYVAQSVQSRLLWLVANNEFRRVVSPEIRSLPQHCRRFPDTTQQLKSSATLEYNAVYKGKAIPVTGHGDT
jgi:hypothetical protein